MAVFLLLFVAFLFLVKCYITRVPAAPSGAYPVPGPLFCIKRFIYLTLIRYSPKKTSSYGALREQEMLGARKPPNPQHLSTRDLEAPQKLVDNPYAIDSVYFTAFTEDGKSFIIARVARRSENRCEVWLFLRVDGVGDFEHPEHPVTIMATEANDSWGAGGLTVTCLQPFQTWRISFDGVLRKGPFRHSDSDDGGSKVHVTFTLLWTAATDVYDFDYDFNPSTAADAMAMEPLSMEFLSAVKKSKDEHYRYEQWGGLKAKVSIGGDPERQMSLSGIRSHSYGVRDWAQFHRYIMFLIHFENGMFVHLNIVSLPKTTRHLIIGYVFFPAGDKAGIEWSDAHLSNLADDRAIKENYQISFTAGGQTFDVSATLDSRNSPFIYNPSLNSSTKQTVGITHECIATFTTGTGDNGWGLVEFFYRV
ncbi:uncharacterized protein LOC120980429 [Bufo bufo]|uniref:uncharacterized protein LOC120980429 n=1 Tax=Bufo bufo TaxID=8384 RepID=UPI001ABDC7E2|nr:uncharacterized protein LOC120980429 [Bufo bufo]